jgi:hypothetical protein
MSTTDDTTSLFRLHSVVVVVIIINIGDARLARGDCL